jgi:hypothetical protein
VNLFTIFAANRSSPVVDWLKPLAREAHRECGGRGVGVIGLCLTGGFALSMAVDPAVVAPVMGEPGLPYFFHSDKLDISPTDLDRVKARTAAEGLTVRGYRFEGDRLCKAERFATLRRALGPAFIGKEIPNNAANPNGLKAQKGFAHSVFTIDLIDEAEPAHTGSSKRDHCVLSARVEYGLEPLHRRRVRYNLRLVRLPNAYPLGRHR